MPQQNGPGNSYAIVPPKVPPQGAPASPATVKESLTAAQDQRPATAPAKDDAKR